jgi:chorismate dehydratase
MPIRLGAVSYLNTRPLVYGLEAETDLARRSGPAAKAARFHLRFDVPAQCAELLHADAIDLGLIPSIEYPGHDYCIVPGVSIASDGPVASVAVFSRVPTGNIRSIALDTSSRTSVALLRVLCARWFEIEPRLVSMPPDLGRMIRECDAALVIGDNALFTDEQALGLEKVDLGEEWIGMTGLPFVYAFWAGRPGVAGPADVAALQEARDRGLAATAAIGRQSFPDDPEKAARADLYLRENVKYALGEREIAGLRRFYELAAEVGALPSVEIPSFYQA